ncbi:antiterminator, partial [Escherichia coli]|nr:antiterminator [Escherichia coli]
KKLLLFDVKTASIPVRFAKLYREANSRHGHLKEPAFCGFFYD